MTEAFLRRSQFCSICQQGTCALACEQVLTPHCPQGLLLKLETGYSPLGLQLARQQAGSGLHISAHLSVQRAHEVQLILRHQRHHVQQPRPILQSGPLALERHTQRLPRTVTSSDAHFSIS